MHFKLCYKSYPFKMSLAAMREFKTNTGKDLWFTLLSYLECYVAHANEPTITLMAKLTACVDFDTASQALYSLVKAAEPGTELEQLQDGMFRVGWRPVEEEESEFIQPYPLVLVDIATQIDGQFKREIPLKKKEQTGSPDPQT